MTLIRPELANALWRAREVIAAAALGLFGLWLVSLGGWLLQAVGGMALLLSLGWGWQAFRRMRFAQGGEAPGIVEVDEGQISYFGPVTGGAVSLPDLVELRLIVGKGDAIAVGTAGAVAAGACGAAVCAIAAGASAAPPSGARAVSRKPPNRPPRRPRCAPRA